MKKLAGFVFAIAMSATMVLSMSANALAATVTIDTEGKNGILAGHKFAAYQIFAGTQEENSKILTDITWGSGVRDGDMLLEGLKKSTNGNWIAKDFQDAVTAADVAEIVGKYKTDSEEAQMFAKKVAEYLNYSETISIAQGSADLASGYYLIQDVTDKQDLARGGAFNAALLQVTGDDITIRVKTDAPTVEKKVQENTKYAEDAGYGAGYNDAADYTIGDKVPFLLIGSIPDLSNYTRYQYRFHDMLSAGLTAPDWTQIKVYLSDDKTVDADDEDVTDKFRIDVLGAVESGHADEEPAGSTEIKVESKDFLSYDGFKNGAGKYILVSYEAVLNQNAVVGVDGNTNKVFLQYSSNPDADDCYRTPTDTVIVFTYELDTNKVDAENHDKKLDAEFKLRNEAGQWLVVNEAGRVEKWVSNEEEASVLKSGENGFFGVLGLDDATYFLKETKAPAGYNLLKEEVKVTITAHTNHIQNWDNMDPSVVLTGLEVTTKDMTSPGDTKSGIVTITVENNSGSELPETGGVGTTMFYIFGVILVAGAGILLVMKRRVNG